MEAKELKPGERIEIGRQYGFITVLSVAQEGRPKRYNCRCEKCGALFDSRGQNIRKNQVGGCPGCRKSARIAEKIAELNRLHQGKTYGELNIINVYMGRDHCGGIEYDRPWALCRCACGREKEIPLNRILRGGARSCGHATEKNLRDGREISAKAVVGGTRITSFRKPGVRKNSSTGVTGVNKMRDGKYRAYINFRRKQYHLGSFDSIDDAAAARKVAEEKIYGDFLGWYADSYPEQWEKLKAHLH